MEPLIWKPGMCTRQITSSAIKEPLRISGQIHKPDIVRKNFFVVRKNFFIVRKKFYNGKLCHTNILESSEWKVMRIKEIWIERTWQCSKDIKESKSKGTFKTIEQLLDRREDLCVNNQEREGRSKWSISRVKRGRYQCVSEVFAGTLLFHIIK